MYWSNLNKILNTNMEEHMRKLMLIILGTLLATAASAGLKVSGLAVTAYPDQEKIDVAYKVSGVSGSGCARVVIAVNIMDRNGELFCVEYTPEQKFGDNGTHTAVINAASLTTPESELFYDVFFDGYDYDLTEDGDLFRSYLKTNVKLFDIVRVFVFDECSGALTYAKTDNIKNKKGSSSSSVSPAAAAIYSKAMTKTGCVFDGGEDLIGTASVKFGKINKKGLVKVSATITPFAGKKLTASGSFKADEEGFLYGSLKFKSPIGTLTLGAGSEDGEFYFWIGNDDEGDGDYFIEERKVGGSLANGTGYFSVDLEDGLEAPEGYDFIEDLFPEETMVFVSKGGSKLAVPGKAPKVKYNKIREDGEVYYEPSWEDDDWGNPASLKLTYKPKTGIISGSFKVYATNVDYIEENKAPKVKSYTAKLSGIVIDGSGTGFATVKIGKVTYEMQFYFDVEGD